MIEVGKGGCSRLDQPFAVGVSDFNQIDQQVVGDAGAVQCRAKGANIARFGALTAGEGGDDGFQLALLILPAGEFEAQGVAPGFCFAAGGRGLPGCRRFPWTGQQAVAPTEQAVQFAGFAVDRRLGVDGALLFGERGGASGCGGGEIGLGLRSTGLQVRIGKRAIRAACR